MFSNQIVSAARAPIVSAGLAALLAVSGCASSSRGTHEQQQEQLAAAPTPAPAASTESVAPEPQTVTEAVSEDNSQTTTVIGNANDVLKPSAPKAYVVKRGDTLWGIANMFLRDPWLWPEIWYVNPQIQNPHRIYPGDTVRLANGANGQTQLQLVRGNAVRLEPLLRSETIEGPIATLPYGLIGAFLTRPGVLSKEEVKNAPYIVSLRDQHDVASTGSTVYVRRLQGELGSRYSVMHIDEPLKDPQNGHMFGYLGIYTATASLTRQGDPASVELSDGARETLAGDVLIAVDPQQTADFAPHPPAQKVDGQLMAVIDNVLLAGQYEIVALNRGTQDGVDRGTVLTVDAEAQTAVDRCANVNGNDSCWGLGHKVKLPIESEGTLLVFKTYEHMSYAIIMNETDPIHVGDHARTP